MGTNKPRFSITLDEEMFDKVDIYQHKNRIATRSTAIVDLIEKGLTALGMQTEPVQVESKLSVEELDMVEKYRRITDDQRIAIMTTLNTFYGMELKKEEKSFTS